MSEKYAKLCGLKIGEKVLYAHYIPYVTFIEIVTVKDVRPLYSGDDDSELVLDVEELEGYINPLEVYTKENIDRMFKGDK